MRYLGICILCWRYLSLFFVHRRIGFRYLGVCILCWRLLSLVFLHRRIGVRYNIFMNYGITRCRFLWRYHIIKFQIYMYICILSSVFNDVGIFWWRGFLRRFSLCQGYRVCNFYWTWWMLEWNPIGVLRIFWDGSNWIRLSWWFKTLSVIFLVNSFPLVLNIGVMEDFPYWGTIIIW